MNTTVANKWKFKWTKTSLRKLVKTEKKHRPNFNFYGANKSPYHSRTRNSFFTGMLTYFFRHQHKHEKHASWKQLPVSISQGYAGPYSPPTAISRLFARVPSRVQMLHATMQAIWRRLIKHKCVVGSLSITAGGILAFGSEMCYPLHPAFLRMKCAIHTKYKKTQQITDETKFVTQKSASQSQSRNCYPVSSKSSVHEKARWR